MTERKNQAADTSGRLEALARRAGLVLGWEQVWPTLAAGLALCGVFIAISFLGVWLELPLWGRVGGVVLFALGLAWILARLAAFAIPSRAARLGRLDRDSGLAHRPATALDDQLANNSGDPATSALWDLHLKRAETAASNLRLATPSPGMPRRDVFALRALALIALVAAGFIAGPEKYARVLAAFDWRTPGALSVGYRLDAWIDPPGYTGRPPIVLKLRDDGDNAGGRDLTAPVGSTVVVRASEGANVTAEGEGGLALVKPDAEDSGKPPAAKAKSEDQEIRFSLMSDGQLVLKRFGSTIAAFKIASIPDLPPTIEIRGTPTANARGSFTVQYKIDDDYGVVGAEAEFTAPVVNGRPVTGRTLAEAPKMPLALPADRGGLGDGETTADLSEHPWAGARVTMTLSAKDEGGNEGRGKPVEVTLPQRVFTKPLARALVEQRRNLILAPDDRKGISASIDALMIAPDKFGTTSAIFLGLSTIATRLASAKSDPDLLDVADFMWEMALRIEGGNLSEAERDLRSAEQQLRDALQRGAPDEEIKRLMDQLRAAMDKFLNEMARNAEKNQDAQNDNQRMVTPDQLKSMVDRMQEMMKNGDTASAQQLLDQLQHLMENLQTARRPSRPDPRSREMNRAIDELDQLSREEQELRDKTFRNDQKKQAQRNQRQKDGQKQSGPQNGQQGQQQQSQRGEQGQQGQQPGDQADSGDDDGDQQAENGDGGGDQESLAERQQSLRQRLENLKKRMQQFGMDGKDGMDDAETAMREAEGQLGQGEQGRGKAVDAEGRAIEALRKQSQQMAQQMQQNGQQAGQGRGPGDPNGPMREGNESGAADPLGRESHDKRDANNQRYDPLGTPLAQRAQRVLEELRKRLSDPARPQVELDYLERLMKRY